MFDLVARLSRSQCPRESAEYRALTTRIEAEEWDVSEFDIPRAHYNFFAEKNNILIHCIIRPFQLAQLSYLSVGKEDGSAECEICLDKTPWPPHQEEWQCSGHPTFNHIMARGLYRLGFEEESVLSQLPTLTGHEKLELRLSMPREFWPQKWLEEEAK